MVNNFKERANFIWGIAETMYKSEDIEKWASGLKRIYDECQTTGVRVEFETIGTGFLVTFYRPKWEQEAGLKKGGQKRRPEKGVEKLTLAEETILSLTRGNPRISKREMVKRGRLGKKAVDYNIERLKEKGLLKRLGPDKGGHWEVVRK